MRADTILIAISRGLDVVEREVAGATSGHCTRIASICNSMGKLLGMGIYERITLSASALLHDSALTEWIVLGEDMPEHCVKGQRNIDTLRLPTDASGLVLYHHERADGSGIMGLKNIPMGAEIISIADSYDLGKPLDGFTPRLIAALHTQTPGEVMPEWHITGRDAMELGKMVARTIDYKSKFTRRHTIGIAEKAERMAYFYKYELEEMAKLYLAACLHDLGKLATPTEILEKPGRLTDEEFITIKNHVKDTYDMLEGVDPDIRKWASCHHERLDGRGYPFGYGKDALDFNARLMTCIDIYQAVSEERPYHPARSHEETIKILCDMAIGGAVDINIVRDLDVALG